MRFSFCCFCWTSPPSIELVYHLLGISMRESEFCKVISHKVRTNIEKVADDTCCSFMGISASSTDGISVTMPVQEVGREAAVKFATLDNLFTVDCIGFIEQMIKPFSDVSVARGLPRTFLGTITQKERTVGFRCS